MKPSTQIAQPAEPGLIDVQPLRAGAAVANCVLPGVVRGSSRELVEMFERGMLDALMLPPEDVALVNDAVEPLRDGAGRRLGMISTDSSLHAVWVVRRATPYLRKREFARALGQAQANTPAPRTASFVLSAANWRDIYRLCAARAS